MTACDDGTSSEIGGDPEAITARNLAMRVSAAATAAVAASRACATLPSVPPSTRKRLRATAASAFAPAMREDSSASRVRCRVAIVSPHLVTKAAATAVAMRAARAASGASAPISRPSPLGAT